MKTINPNVKNITEWVLDTFIRNKNKTEQSFNVFSYSKEEKETAIKELKELGYTAILENNNNSLKVTQ
jgi:hypothetical protein